MAPRKSLFPALDVGQILGIFRIVFGLVIFWEFYRLAFTPMGGTRYFNTVFHFKYPWFQWVKAAPDEILHVIFFVGAGLSILFAIGIFFRWIAPLLFLCYTYVFLLDVSYWNNHYYLFSLLLLIFCLTQSNTQYSLDKRMGRTSTLPLPDWQLNIFQFQIGLAFVFGAWSKLINPDWLNGVSMEYITSNSFTRLGIETSADTMSFLAGIQTWGGFLFDLFIIPLLLWKRTFWFGVFLMLVFNISNIFLLKIGSFPFAVLGSLILFYPYRKASYAPVNVSTRKSRLIRKVVLSLVVIQLLLPFRHFFYTGNVFWTSEGKVGAWNMMSGSTTVYAHQFLLVEKQPDGSTNSEIIILDNYLNPKQVRTMGRWPSMIPQFAHFLKKEAEEAGFEKVEIYGDVRVSRNGRHPKPVISIKQELSGLRTAYWGHNDYVLLYEEEGF